MKTLYDTISEHRSIRSYQKPELKKLIEETGAKNLAQIYTKAKYTRESHLGYSQVVLNFLKKNNFMNNY